MLSALGLWLILAFCQVALAQPTTQISGSLLSGEPITINLAQPQSGGSERIATQVTDPGSSHSLLIFWASWCPTCMREIPHLKQLHSRYSARVHFVGINVNKQVADGLRIEQQRELPYPSLTDPDLAIADRFGVRGTPTLILLSANGREIARTTRIGKEFLSLLESVSL